MKWIKNIFISIIGLIALAAISLFVFKTIRSSNAKETLIPANTTGIIQINIDDLLIEVAGNALSNPKTYFFPKKDSSAHFKTKIWQTGLDIPAVAYLFATNEKNNQFYLLQKVNNRDQFLNYLKERFHIEVDSSNSTNEIPGFSYFQTKNFAFLIGEKKIVFSLGMDSTTTSHQLKEIITNNQKDWINALEWTNKHFRGHQTGEIKWITNSGDWVGLDFLNGSIHADAKFSSDKWTFPQSPAAIKPTSDAVLSFSLNANLNGWMKSRDSLLQRLKLPIDSLYKYYGGYIDIQWLKDEIQQQETIVSYEYDDNFQMKEVSKTQIISAPNLLIRLKASPHLLGYLPENLFYKFGKSNKSDLLSIFTDSTNIDSTTFEERKSVLYFDYIKSPTIMNHLGWIPSVDVWQKIHIEGRAKDANTLQLHGYFTLSNEKLHSLYQLNNY